MQPTTNSQHQPLATSVFVRYGVAVSAAVLATLFTLLLWPFIQTSFFPLFSLAVLVSAWVGGLGPGLLTTVLAGVVNAYFFLVPFYSLAVTVDGLLKLSVFTFVAVLISILTDRRQRAEKAERAQREYFQVTLASIGDAVIVTDPTGVVTFLNRVAEEVTSWTTTEARGKPLPEVFRIVNEETRQPVENPVTKVLRTGGVAGLANHTILLAKDGRECPIDDSAAPIRDAEGRLLGIILVFRDITERKQSEVALTKSEQRWRALAETLPAMVWTAAPDGTITYANEQWLHFCGLTPDENRDAWPQLVLHPEDQERCLLQWTQALRDGTPYEIEVRNRRHDGGYRWLLTRALPVRDAAGRITGWYGTTVDIHERKQTEYALRRSEQELADFFENAAVGLHWVGPDGLIQRVNRTELDLLGYTTEEYLGHAIAEFHADSAVIADILQRLARGETLTNYEARLRCKDGTLKTVLIDSNVLWEDGRFLHTRCFTRDVTERKRLEEAVARQTEDLQRINAELQQFAYIVSHDLNEPLRTMRNYIQLLARQMKGKLDGDTEEYMAFVTDAAQRMQQMLTDLLSYTRAGQTLELHSVDCEAVLAQVLRALQAQITERDAIITHDPLPTVSGDATRLGQVLQNLIGNALKFCEAKPPRVHIAAIEEDDHWLFSIRDNGIGIEPQQIGRLFQVFQRLHTRNKYTGSGIGLAICKKIIEQHGGRIWVESTPREGSIFYFTISDKKPRTRIMRALRECQS